MTAEPRRRSSWAGWSAAALVLLPVLYVLSIGPIVKLESSGFESDWFWYAAEVFYAPVNWLADQNALFRDWLTYYADIWA